MTRPLQYLFEIKLECVALTTNNVLHSSIVSRDSLGVDLNKRNS